MNKKIMVALLTITAAFVVNARPHGGPHGGFHGGGFRPPMHHHGSNHGGFWGRGGRNFWPGFVGGVVGGALWSRPYYYPSTVVVAPPVAVAPTVVSPAVVSPVYPSTTVVADTVPTTVQTVTAVPAQPVVQTYQVYVPGRYVDTKDAYGRLIRVWVEGHYETVTR